MIAFSSSIHSSSELLKLSVVVGAHELTILSELKPVCNLYIIDYDNTEILPKNSSEGRFKNILEHISTTFFLFSKATSKSLPFEQIYHLSSTKYTYIHILKR